MRRLLTLQLVQSALAQFTGLHGSLAILAQILARRDIVVNAIVDLCTACAHQSVRKGPVGDEQGGGAVGDLLARGGTKAESGQNGTTMRISDSSRALCEVLHVRHDDTVVDEEFAFPAGGIRFIRDDR